MTFDILTLFPDMAGSPFAESIVGKAVDKGLIEINAHNLRDWATGRHQTTDDSPYGGGDGMVFKPEPAVAAIRALKAQRPEAKVLLMSPQGKRFDQQEAARLAREPALIFLCGRYEGFDERIRSYVDDEYSIGDFVLTGGELAAMVMIDAIARLVPGVLGSSGSAASDSFTDGLLEYPQYTRPVEFEGKRVPDVLLSGNHAEIARWRRREQLRRTLLRRPDLLEDLELDADEQKTVAALRAELEEDGK